METNITFIIADNQDITRTGMLVYISSKFHTVEVATKKGLIRALAQYNNAIIILDYTLFDLNGIEELLITMARFPATHWIMFSNELTEDFIRRMSLEKNASIILKENSSEEIHAALFCVAQGKRFLCHQATNLLLSAASPNKREHFSLLTSTETDILRLIALGRTVKEIADERNISIHTVISHKKNIFRKLEVNSVYEATKYALRAGLVNLVEYYI